MPRKTARNDPGAVVNLIGRDGETTAQEALALPWVRNFMSLKKAWSPVTENGAMPPAILGGRDGRQLVLIQPLHVQRDRGMEALSRLREQIGLPEFWCAFDAFHREFAGEDEPATKTGQFQQEWEAGNPAGQVRQAMLLYHLTPSADPYVPDIGLLILPYQGGGAKTPDLTWDDPGLPSHVSGTMIEFFRDIYAHDRSRPRSEYRAFDEAMQALLGGLGSQQADRFLLGGLLTHFAQTQALCWNWSLPDCDRLYRPDGYHEAAPGTLSPPGWIRQ